MWDKPTELTDYNSTGYEISYAGSADAAGAVENWLMSPGHRAVILNEGAWAGRTWRGIGGGRAGNHWNVWFGELTDPGWPRD